jgi:RND family efflux transporter MFP subunit
VSKFYMLFLALLFALPATAADLPAMLQWSQRVELAAPTSGIVQTVHVNVGDRVKKGQALVTLDPSVYRAAVTEAQADVVRAQAEEADAKRNLDRIQELYNRTVISTTELEQAQVRQVRAKTQLESAKARLAASQTRLRDTSVRAPFDGIVLVRQVEPGQALASLLQPQPLIVLARAGEMLAQGRASLAQVSKLKVGEGVTVAVEGRNYQGRIKTLGLEPMGDKNDAGYPVDVLFPVKELLRAGTPATIRLP